MQATMSTDQNKTIFQRALPDFELLPEPVRDLHSIQGVSVYRGKAVSAGPTGLSGYVGAWLFGFPGAAKEIPVSVTITADAQSETWQRRFANKTFKSHLSLDRNSFVCERFGPIKMQLGLYQSDSKLYFPVTKGWLLGVVPLPAFLLPRSSAFETQDGQGRFVFDVLVSSPFGARIAHYSGWLQRSG